MVYLFKPESPVSQTRPSLLIMQHKCYLSACIFRFTDRTTERNEEMNKEKIGVIGSFFSVWFDSLHDLLILSKAPQEALRDYV